ncbi:MAG: class I SAM-dependent methyltransferase [Planctomycetes bacterium]|nr:class I SAM-dependent methyltransferase [Planctomycetota bacterium]
MNPALAILRKIVLSARRFRTAITFKARFGFDPPPHWSDLSGYESLLSVILKNRLCELEGDFVEIGAFLGGGTYKLCKLLQIRAPAKKVYSIDIFAASTDRTACALGDTMESIYRKALRGRDQLSVFREVTRDCGNLICIVGDSARVELPAKKISFGYVDGNHDPAYVRGDFSLIWSRLTPGGIIAFDDYGFDLPDVTRTIDDIVKEHGTQIARTWKKGWKTFFIQKAAS